MTSPPILEQSFEGAGGNGSAADSWTGTETALSVAGLLKRARRVVVLTHAKPDGDAIGSTAALVRALRALSIEATAWYVGPMPRWFDEVVGELPHRVLNAEQVRAGVLAHEPEPEVIVVCDTGAWAQLDELRPWLEPRTARTVVIDHHLSGSVGVATRRLLDPQAAAACEPVAEVCQRLLVQRDLSRLPKPIAEMLYLGLGTDTGWFRYSSTRPNTLRLAAALMEAGVNHSRLFAAVQQQDRPARLRLLGRAFAAMEVFDHDFIVFLPISARDFEECHGDAEDAQAFATIALDVAAVQVAATLFEVAGRPAEKPLTKISIRSKPGPHAIDVAAVARSLGGGGHARAAGLKLELPLPVARDALLAAIRTARESA